MTDEDEKAGRGKLGPPRAKGAPIVRTTAPAGTPAKPDSYLADPIGGSSMRGPPVAPSPSAPRGGHSDRPMNALTPPRTVGGHTARLNVTSDIDTDAPPSSLPVVHTGASTVGGTMRMIPPPDLSQAPGLPSSLSVPFRASPTVHEGTAGKSPAQDGASPNAASIAMGPQAAPNPAPPAAALGSPAAAVPVVAPVRASAGPPTDWFSPLPVAVGLISFALGCMIGLVADGRMARSRPAVAATTPEAAASTAAPAAPAKASATAAATTATPSASAVATTTAPVAPATAPVAPAATTAAVAPATTQRPIGGPRPPKPPPTPPTGKGKPGRPGLPFD